MSRCTAQSVFHCHDVLPVRSQVSQCTALLDLNCHDALIGQSSTITMHCPVFFHRRSIARSVFFCPDALLGKSSVTMHCSASLPLSQCTFRSDLKCHDVLVRPQLS
ncbi:hypothetical protein PoB_004559700 [Plakobranchus ocellatus]|uniref:Uncharacterized protein n=1 Tax=Plakobranchus ocellatus TaxID=259542 RepID=A0AAV4BIA1_9GAST|nr:hypothetical protein PoB_004559700 [Plakobranchus ocellatus]